jgi:peptidoglycan/LPS O-acetylase OafA/YrhL
MRPPEAPRTFLAYLEGIRGFCGVYIALIHTWLRACQLRPNLSRFTPFPQHFVAFNHATIAIFIVISGYVLGLPVARRGQTFSGSIATFIQRRALRILPAYFAALVIATIVSLIVAPVFGEQLTPHGLLTSLALHVTMLHNLSNRAIVTLDAPMWSVAVECDIYLLFPFVLVPLARRFGFGPMIAAAWALGLTPTLIGALRHRPASYSLAETCLWYIGCFALGYAAANFLTSKDPVALRRLERWPWQPLAVVFFVGVVISSTFTRPFDIKHGGLWLIDLFAGLAIAAQFIADAQARARGRRTWFERFFLWRPLLILGTFSYSFYLIHLPIIDLIISRAPANWSGLEVVALGLGGLVLALGVAYGFYRAFERPFMTAYRRRGDAESVRARA